MQLSPDQQATNDHEHLRLLALFTRLYGALLMLGSLCFLPHLLFAPFFGREFSRAQPTEAVMFTSVFMFAALIGMTALLTLGVLHFVAAKRMDQRRGWIFVIVIAAIDCMNAPLGTVLGVFTIIVLNRRSVRQLFDANTAPPVI